jgi:hypothetical protein
MSNGKKIDDRSFWAGSGANGSVFPMGAKVKGESSAEGAGHLPEYQDTTEGIKKVQEKGVSQAKAHPMKSGYRN